MIYITATSVAGLAWFVWFWRRERKGRKSAQRDVVLEQQLRIKGMELLRRLDSYQHTPGSVE